MRRYAVETTQQEAEREMYGGNVVQERVLVPLALSCLAGAGVSVVVLAGWFAVVGDLTAWRAALVCGVLAGGGLLVWRCWWEVRLPVLRWLESLTGEDIDGDGAIGAPSSRVPFTEAALDRRARQVLRLAAEGRPITRSALVPKMLSRGEWEGLMSRLVARGICERGRDGSAVLKYKTFGEAWERYTAPQVSTQFWLDTDGGLVSKQ